MSESDISIPQKVAALANALEAVRRHIGSESKLDRWFHAWLKAGPGTLPWFTRETARNYFLAATAEFVEAVDTAERMLNAVPLRVLKPLSRFTGGVRWDMRTRRTLKEIQASISILRNHSTKPDYLLVILRAGGNAEFNNMQHALSKFLNELSDRILDLQSRPHHDPPRGRGISRVPSDEQKAEACEQELQIALKTHQIRSQVAATLSKEQRRNIILANWGLTAAKARDKWQQMGWSPTLGSESKTQLSKKVKVYISRGKDKLTELASRE